VKTATGIVHTTPIYRGAVAAGLLFSLLLSGCAYFNTFYNADFYYNEGLRALEAAGEQPRDTRPQQATTAFNAAIEKSRKVIDNYPESRFVDDAFFILGRSHYYLEQYGLAERYFQQLLSEYPWLKNSDEVRVWLAKVHGELGLYEQVDADLEPIISMESPPRRLLTQIYILRGDMALKRGDIPRAFESYEAGVRTAETPATSASILYDLYALALESENYTRALDYLDRYARKTPVESERVGSRLKRVQLLQMLGDIDKAYAEIQGMMNLSEFTRIIPGLRLEIAKIELSRGNRSEAMDLFVAITEEFRNSVEASEAYFNLGTYYLTELYDMEEARSKFAQVRNKSPYYTSARLKLKQIATLDKIEKQIKDLRGRLGLDSDGEKPVNAKDGDVAPDTTKLRQDLAYASFRLGEIRLIELQDRETGLEIMSDIVSNYGATAVASQAAYVLYYHTRDNPAQESFWRSLLLEKYPSSMYALSFSVRDDTQGDPRLEALIAQADSAVIYNPRTALQTFEQIQSEYGLERASFSMAYLYDEYFGELNNAITAYEEHLERYPETGVYGEMALERLDVLLDIKASLTALQENSSGRQ